MRRKDRDSISVRAPELAQAVRHVMPQLRVVARVGAHDCRALVLESVEVHRRFRKVLEPSCMIDIEVRDDDVPYVLGSEPKRAHLRERRFLEREPRPERPTVHPRHPQGCLGDVMPHPRIDEYETVNATHLRWRSNDEHRSPAFPHHRFRDRAKYRALEPAATMRSDADDVDT